MKKKKYWYKTDIYYCVLCGKEDRVKERIYSDKPKEPQERTIWYETACSEHV
jgi:hypothetical protein